MINTNTSYQIEAIRPNSEWRTPWKWTSDQLVKESSTSRKWVAGVLSGIAVQPIFEIFYSAVIFGLGGGYSNVKSNFIGGVIIMPILEEVIFRGILQNGIGYIQKSFFPTWKNSIFGTAFRVYLQAILFGLVHCKNRYLNKYEVTAQVICAIAAGVYLGKLAERTGNIAASIGVHMGINLGLITVKFD